MMLRVGFSKLVGVRILVIVVTAIKFRQVEAATRTAITIQMYTSTFLGKDWFASVVDITT